MITTKTWNDNMVTTDKVMTAYFYFEYGINNVIPTGKKASKHIKNLFEEEL